MESKTHHLTSLDSAYMDTISKEALKVRHIFCGIDERRVSGLKGLTVVQKWHNHLVVGFRAVIEYPFAWMKNTGCYRGHFVMVMISRCMTLHTTSKGPLAYWPIRPSRSGPSKP